MWSIPDEDAYWERRREEYEKQFEPEYPLKVNDTVYLDEELDELEERYQCKIEELTEADLVDIVQELTGILPDTAKYVQNFCGIDYEYQESA